MELDLNSTKIDYGLIEKGNITFKKNTKAKQIFHYTSIGGLEGILTYKKLRFTNIKYMNDKDEIIAGLDSIAKACDASDEERESLLSAFINHGTQTFVCCFSLEEDSLPMWNYYTKEINNQGFNIEFDDKKLVESILKSNPCLDGCDFAFGIVDYSKDNDSEYSRTITNEVLSSMNLSISKLFLAVAKGAILNRPTNIDKSAIQEWEEKISDTEKKIKLSDLPIYFFNGATCSFDKNPYGDYLYFIKRDCFKQEREFRIVISVPDYQLPRLKQEKAYKFRVSNGVLVPYLELGFSGDVIKGITISPTVKSDLVEQSIQDFTTYCNLPISDYSTFIRKSKVTVRF